MSSDQEYDEEYRETRTLRKQAIKILAGSQEALEQNLRDPDNAKILVKLLDGQDKQTIARQRNKSIDKQTEAIGSLAGAADQLFGRLTGRGGIRGEADASKSPKGEIPAKVDVKPGEMADGVDENLNYENIMNQS